VDRTRVTAETSFCAGLLPGVVTWRITVVSRVIRQTGLNRLTAFSPKAQGNIRPFAVGRANVLYVAERRFGAIPGSA
jgi:hypothetical protein